jgi:phage shock protein A
MELTKLLIIIACVLFGLMVLFFPEFRKLVLGWTRVFIKDLATTPEGAEAIYAEKIDEAQDKYNKADNALRTAAGKLHTEEEKLKTLLKNLKDVEAKCEALVQAGKYELAQIKADEREEILSSIERSKKLIEAYSAAKQDAQEVHKACDANLRKLKRESKEVVENMRVKAQLNEVYDSMDDLKNVTATDKLLDSIKEKNDDLNASVAGARVIHENRTSTKIQRANEQAKQLQSNDYLESLKKKYKK